MGEPTYLIILVVDSLFHAERQLCVYLHSVVSLVSPYLRAQGAERLLVRGGVSVLPSPSVSAERLQIQKWDNMRFSLCLVGGGRREGRGTEGGRRTGRGTG